MNAVETACKAEIDMMHTLLTKKFGQLYADIWKVGVNLSLRISDLLKLKYSDLNLEDRSLKLIEAKTGKHKWIRLNGAAISVISRRQQEHPGDVWLFQVHCNRANDKPISRVSVSRVFKEAGDVLGLSINTHSMRKSRGIVKKRAKLSRVLGKRALKSFHPRLFNVQFFTGESWSVSHECYSRNQTALSPG